MDSKKIEVIQTRISLGDKKIIDNYLKKNNVTMSSFIRNTLLEKVTNE